jgi:ABC-type glycerol-3-phosphate transport system substrate-binding protein
MRIFSSLAALLATAMAVAGCASLPRESAPSSAALPTAAVAQTEATRLSNQVFMDE